LTVSLDDAPAVLAQRGNPDHSLDRRNMREAIDGALERLPVEQREAFLLKHVEGLSYVEISEILDVSVPALKMRVHRARDELKVLLRMYDR
jgi:RNA polymerase sigma-70 factor (ECF subfamily)